MKKLMMLCILVCAALFVQAQAKDSTLQDFVGKYKFPDGSVVTEVVVSMEGESLVMSSSVGNSTLVKTNDDEFTITEFNGTAKFKRDANKKVVGVSVNAAGYLLEGTKDSITSSPTSVFLLQRNMYFLLK